MRHETTRRLSHVPSPFSEPRPQVLVLIGGRTRTRTLDPLIKSQLLWWVEGDAHLGVTVQHRSRVAKDLVQPACCILSALPSQVCHRTVPGNSKRREMCSDRVRNVARRKVRVVLFRHARIGVAELFRNDTYRNTFHGKRRPCVWRSTWNETAGLIFACLQASSIGRN